LRVGHAIYRPVQRRLLAAVTAAGVVLAFSPSADATPVELIVTYNTPSDVFGPVSFGLSDLPSTVTSEFFFDSSSLMPDATTPDLFHLSLGGVTSAHSSFGDGDWTQLANFAFSVSLPALCIHFPCGPDFVDLHYSFVPITAEGVANGGVLNNSFQLTVTGTDTATGEDFDYFYSGATERLVDVPEPLTVSLFGVGLAGLFAVRRRSWAVRVQRYTSTRKLASNAFSTPIWRQCGAKTPQWNVRLCRL